LNIFGIKWNKLPFVGKYRSINRKFIPIINKLPARLRKTKTSKLKMKRQNENIELKGTARKDFVFADPLLPFGTIGEASTHCTHLQITQADT